MGVNMFLLTLQALRKAPSGAKGQLPTQVATASEAVDVLDDLFPRINLADQMTPELLEVGEFRNRQPYF
jgi:hypothetical protein